MKQMYGNIATLVVLCLHAWKGIFMMCKVETVDTNHQTEIVLDNARVKLIFAPQPNEEVIDNVKNILLKSMLRRTASSTPNGSV